MQNQILQEVKKIRSTTTNRKAPAIQIRKDISMDKQKEELLKVKDYIQGLIDRCLETLTTKQKETIDSSFW